MCQGKLIELTEKNLFLLICDLINSRYIYVYIFHSIYIYAFYIQAKPTDYNH